MAKLYASTYRHTYKHIHIHIHTPIHKSTQIHTQTFIHRQTSIAHQENSEKRNSCTPVHLCRGVQRPICLKGYMHHFFYNLFQFPIPLSSHMSYDINIISTVIHIKSNSI